MSFSEIRKFLIKMLSDEDLKKQVTTSSTADDVALIGQRLGYNFSGDGILTALQISKYCKKKNIKLNDWLKSSFKPFPQKLTNIKLDFNINKLNSKNKILIDESIKNFQAIYSDNCRVYIRPSGTEPVILVLVEATNQKKVNYLSSEITKKLFLEINKIMN